MASTALHRGVVPSIARLYGFEQDEIRPKDLFVVKYNASAQVGAWGACHTALNPVAHGARLPALYCGSYYNDNTYVDGN